MHCRCICASTILWSPQVVPRPFLILPVVVQVMTEHDILSDIGFCAGVITALKLCRPTVTVHNCFGMLRLRALCVAVCIPVVD